jgi:hypothetical protein
MTLRVPQPVRRAWKAARPKKTAMTYEQAAAIVAEGLARGTRRHRSIVLGVAAHNIEISTMYSLLGAKRLRSGKN